MSKVSDDVNEGYTLSSNNRRQHLGGILKSNVGSNIDAESCENRHGNSDGTWRYKFID